VVHFTLAALGRGPALGSPAETTPIEEQGKL